MKALYQIVLSVFLFVGAGAAVAGGFGLDDMCLGDGWYDEPEMCAQFGYAEAPGATDHGIAQQWPWAFTDECEALLESGKTYDDCYVLAHSTTLVGGPGLLGPDNEGGDSGPGGPGGGGGGGDSGGPGGGGGGGGGGGPDGGPGNGNGNGGNSGNGGGNTGGGGPGSGNGGGNNGQGNGAGNGGGGGGNGGK